MGTVLLNSQGDIIIELQQGSLRAADTLESVNRMRP